MKETLSVFGSEIFRPLMTVFAPGAIALAPWIVGLMMRCTEFKSFVNSARTEASFLMALAALITGMVLEDVGTWLERQTFDARRNKLTNNEHESNWWLYLRMAWPNEPVGARYMRTVLLRMKFELGIATGCVIAAIGVFTLDLALTKIALLSITIALLLLSALLYREAMFSHKVLSDTRAELLKGPHVF
jgi:hypothetical protein